MEKQWTTLYKEAKNAIKAHSIPPFIEYGNNSCAIITDNNNIYTGVSIASNGSIGSSAERTAITMMLNAGENIIKKMVILNELEEVILPSEECIDSMIELTSNTDDFEILTDYETREFITLTELLPSWWGTYRNKKN